MSSVTRKPVKPVKARISLHIGLCTFAVFMRFLWKVWFSLYCRYGSACAPDHYTRSQIHVWLLVYWPDAQADPYLHYKENLSDFILRFSTYCVMLHSFFLCFCFGIQGPKCQYLGILCRCTLLKTFEQHMKIGISQLVH